MAAKTFFLTGLAIYHLDVENTIHGVQLPIVQEIAIEPSGVWRWELELSDDGDFAVCSGDSETTAASLLDQLVRALEFLAEAKQRHDAATDSEPESPAA